MRTRRLSAIVGFLLCTSVSPVLAQNADPPIAPAPGPVDCTKVDLMSAPADQTACPFTIQALVRAKAADVDRANAAAIDRATALKAPGTDQRENLQLTIHLDLTLDAFAAGSINTYLNQGASGDIKERFTGGFEAEYRAWGHREDAFQVWLYGRSIYGVRSADVDCKSNPDLPVCQIFTGKLQNPGQAALYILRNASSLEAFAGVRVEFLGLQPGLPAYAHVYLSSQLGFLSVANLGQDVADDHQYIALGTRVVEGRFQNSFFEVGWGKNDLFAINRNRRVKFTARGVSTAGIPQEGIIAGLGYFAQISADVDFGRGADSVQTQVGFIYDFGPLSQ